MDSEQYNSRRRHCRCRYCRRRIVSSLPDEIVHDILVHLPATILLKFKSICKSWLATVADPRFIATHTDRMVNSPSSSTLLLFRTKYTNFLLYDYRSGTCKTFLLRDVFPYPKHYHLYHPEDVPRNDIIPSVNGLLLLRSTRINHARKPYTRVYICNPCTRETVPLPVLDVRLDSLTSFTLGGGHLDIPPSPLPSHGILTQTQYSFRSRTETFWFGVDPSTGKYKVVQFMDKIDRRPSLCHVFTQGGDRWREVAHCPPFVRLTKFPVALNGVLYGMTDIDNSSDGMILSFDLVEERLTLVPSPPHLKGVEVGIPFSSGRKTMVVLQGRLSVVDCFTADCRLIMLDIWMLNDNEPNNNNNNVIKRGCCGAGKYEWSKVQSFEILPKVHNSEIRVLRLGQQPVDWIKRVTLTQDGKFLITTFNNTLHSFDPETNSATRLLQKQRRCWEYRRGTSFLHGDLDIDVLEFSTTYTETMAPAG